MRSAALQIAEIEELTDLGVPWIQLDSLSYSQVFDEEFRAATGLGAVAPDDILDAAGAELIRAAKRTAVLLPADRPGLGADHVPRAGADRSAEQMTLLQEEAVPAS